MTSMVALRSNVIKIQREASSTAMRTRVKPEVVLGLTVPEVAGTPENKNDDVFGWLARE